MDNKADNWSFAKLQKSFGLRQKIGGSPLLEQWMSATDVLSNEDNVVLDNARLELEENVLYWNEEELKMNFISTIIRMVKFDNGVRTFFEREIKADVQGTILKAKSDYMIAKGFGDIVETPYFCFHEYKQEKRPSEDPAAQVLKAMLIAREANKNQKPVYGCYVAGRNWYFLILDGDEFAIGNPLSATEGEALRQIVRVLRHFKTILYTTLQSNG